MSDINRLTERVRSRITVSDDGCWLYPSSSKNGYTAIWIDGRTVQGHRYAYETIVGPIPEELEIDHLCRVRNCINPEHLEAVTHQVNIQRGDTGQHWTDKTRCPQGHPYDKENTYISPEGWRACCVCRRDAARRSRARKKANA